MISSDLGVPRRLAVRGAIVIAVIALTGCGSSSSSSTNKTTTASTAAATTPTTTTPPAAPAPDKAADERVARNAQLRLADFPAGWEESDKVSATNQAPCQAINEAKAATNARDKSREFSKGGDNAESAAYIYADTATASHWLAEAEQ